MLSSHRISTHKHSAALLITLGTRSISMPSRANTLAAHRNRSLHHVSKPVADEFSYAFTASIPDEVPP